MKNFFITALFAVTPLILSAAHANPTGKYGCEGDGVLQMNIVGDPSEPAKFVVEFDMAKNSITRLAIEARIPVAATNIGFKFRSEDNTYYRFESGHGYINDLQFQVLENFSQVALYFSNDTYWHYAAGYSANNFGYTTEPLTCTEIN